MRRVALPRITDWYQAKILTEGTHQNVPDLSGAGVIEHHTQRKCRDTKHSLQ